jgi:hypothetical protein
MDLKIGARAVLTAAFEIFISRKRLPVAQYGKRMLPDDEISVCQI